MDDRHSRGWFRFSLMGLLLAMTLLAIAMGLYFAGYRNGYSDGASRASREEIEDYLQMVRPQLERRK